MLKPNTINNVRRLQGLASSNRLAPTIEFIQGQIDRSTRNYESNMGRETSKVTTASGLAQLRADAGSQSSIKSADRLSGYRRLFEIVDWAALEFYDDSREIYLGAKRRDEKNVSFTFNSQDVMGKTEPIIDPMTGEVFDGKQYFPIIDATINVGGGAIKNQQVSLSALDRMSATKVSRENYKILSSELDILDIPQRQEIISNWEQLFGIDEEIAETLVALPEMQEKVKSFLSEQLVQMQTDNIIQQKTAEIQSQLQQVAPQETIINEEGAGGMNLSESPLSNSPYTERV